MRPGLSRFAVSGTVIGVSARSEEPVAIPLRWGHSGECQSGEDPAVIAAQALFARCERPIGRFLVQLVGDRSLAEDLLQDTFHDAFRARPQLLAAPNPEAWLFTIARNRALSALRRRRRSIVALARLPRPLERSEREVQEVVALRDLLERHLDAEERALLLLRYLHGFDANELAEMVGVTPEAVRQRLSRSRRKLISASEVQPSGKET
jgi:RNA polymerase sigma-70 factor (ECF subfamily)